MRINIVRAVLATCILALVPAAAAHAGVPDPGTAAPTSTTWTDHGIVHTALTTTVHQGQLLPGGMVAATDDMLKESCVYPVYSGVRAENCLVVTFHRHNATTETVTSIYAWKATETPIAFYANLWRNITILECTDQTIAYNPTNDRAVFFAAANPAGAACGGARFFADRTRFHTTWQNLPDDMHPIVFVP